MTVKADVAAWKRGAPWGVGAALVAVLACAAAPAAAHGQAPHLRSGRVVLTNADDGRTVSVHTGDDIEVRLTGQRQNGLNYTWRVPQSSDPAVLHRTAGGTTPTGSATAVFHAEKDGTATITSAKSCRPDPGRTCPLVVTPWKVTVEVN
ncbi:hypothetical protein ABZ766_13760 [Streptomyces sp. NPDC006670]|uniref:hypothetical protein n=1 Tax=Streptomyces sp. NPDC006670 TaxID=3154476 RepID=UPI0033ED644E